MDTFLSFVEFACFIGIIYLIIMRVAKGKKGGFKTKLGILIVILIISCGQSSSIDNNKNYDQAMKYYNNKQYSKALKSFKQVDDASSKYSKAKSKIKEIDSIIQSPAKYSKGMDLMNKKKYADAVNSFKKVCKTDDNYKNAQQYITKCISLDKEQKAKEAKILEAKKLAEQKLVAAKKAAKEKAEKLAEIKAQQEEERKEKEAEQKAQNAIQDYKNSCKAVDYADIARQPDDYKGQKVVFSGKVIQVMEDGNDVQLRVDVSQGDSEPSVENGIIFVNYTRVEGESRILENDIITLYGRSNGLYTYESTLGASVTIPQVDAKYVYNNGQGED